MAYGNLPGGGFSGFVKAKQPLAIKRRSYVPIAEWPEEYKEYLDQISSQEAERESESLDEGLVFKTKRPPEAIDERLETEGGVDEDTYRQRIKRFLKEKFRKEDYKRPEETRLKSKDKKESFEDYSSDFPKIVSTKKAVDKQEKISKELKTKVPSDKSSDVTEQEYKLDDTDFLDVKKSPKGGKRKGDDKSLEKSILESKGKRSSSEKYSRDYFKTIGAKKSEDKLEKFERETKPKVLSDKPPHADGKEPKELETRIDTEEAADFQHPERISKVKRRKGDDIRLEQARLKTKEKKASYEDSKIVPTEKSKDKFEKRKIVPIYKPSDTAEKELKLETEIDEENDFLTSKKRVAERGRKEVDTRSGKPRVASKVERSRYEDYPRDYSNTVSSGKVEDKIEKIDKPSDAAEKEDQLKLEADFDEETGFLTSKKRVAERGRKEVDTRSGKPRVASKVERARYEDYLRDYSKAVSSGKVEEKIDKPSGAAEKEDQLKLEADFDEETGFLTSKKRVAERGRKEVDTRSGKPRVASKVERTRYEDYLRDYSKTVSSGKVEEKIDKPSDAAEKEDQLKLEADFDEETGFLTSKKRVAERGRKEVDTRSGKPRVASKVERARYEDYPRDYSKTVSSGKVEDKIEKIDKPSDAAEKEDQLKLEADFDEETDFLSAKRRSTGKRRKGDDKIPEKTRLESRQKKTRSEDYPTDYSKVISGKRAEDKQENFYKKLKTKEPIDKFFGTAEKERRDFELETDIDKGTDFFTVKRRPTRRGIKEDDKLSEKDGLKIKETQVSGGETLSVDKADKRKDGRIKRVPREVSKRKTKESSKDYTKSILKKEDGRKKKVGKGRMKTVTFDDENLVVSIPSSEVESMEESESTKDEVVIEMGDEQDASVLPGEDGAIPEVSDEPEMPEIRIKFRRPRRNPTYTYFKRKRSIFRFSPCIDRLMYSQRLEYRGLKAMLGFPIGAVFGFALYWIVLERLNAEHYYCWLLGICVGTGFALSTQVRCICFLSVPACFGRAGRAFVSTYIVAYVIEGPLLNIMANAKESMRSISCTASLNLNHTVERFKLMFQPVKEIVGDFMGAGKKVQDDTKQLEKAFTDIENEVRDEGEIRESMSDTEALDNEVGGESRVDIIKTKFSTRKKKSREFGEVSEKKYGMKSEFRCEGVFNKGVRGCYKSFDKAYDKCHSSLPIIGYLLCWPMKLTFICDLASSLMGKRACDTNDVLNPGFGASVDTADGVQSEFEKDFAVQLQYKLTIPEESVEQLSPEDVAGAMKYSFERRKRNLEFAAHLVDRILALLVLLVILSSRKYCNKYLRTIQFDNKYITSYFRHIDARRKKKGKMILLPLKKVEHLELSSPFSVKFTPDEKIMLIMNGVRLVSEAFTVLILLMFDRFFYEFLDLIKRHAHVTYKQTGAHHIKMTIYGNGFVANMIRGILKGFDKKHSLDQVTTTEECLPLPTKLPQEKIIRLCAVFLILMILIILQTYTLRLRRVICAFFYPKREKRRIIFLYNDRLKKRRSYLQHMRHTVRKQAREQAIAIDSGVFFSLRKFYPKYFSWLSKFGLGLSQCLICREKESGKCRLVDCSECPFSYCSDCWQDTEEKCYVCLPDDDTEPSEDSLSDE